MAGLAETWQLTRPALSPPQSDVATTLAAIARRMSALVNNLLEMARLESGTVRLDLQWQPAEEVIGSALAAASPVMLLHLIEVAIPEDMPVVRFDAVLMERMLSTCWKTLRGTRRPGLGCASLRTLQATASSWFPTTDKGCRRGARATCSASSSAANAKALHPASVWGWRCAAPSSRRMAGRSRPRTRPMAVRAS